MLICSASSLAVQGFTEDACKMSVQMYSMLQDQLNHFLQERDLSTDEDDEVESLIPKDVCSVEAHIT
jgi:succinate dehydrogenase/fumarate reductase-like Fe-S protein